MSNLYDLTTELKTLMDMLSDTELDEEAVKNCLEGVKFEFDKKVAGYGMVIRSLEADGKAFQEEADFYQRKATTINNNIKKLKNAILSAMISTDQTDIKTDKFCFKVQNNGGKQPLVIDGDVPDSMTKVIIEPDNEKIRSFLSGLDENDVCAWAHLEPRGKHLVIK